MTTVDDDALVAALARMNFARLIVNTAARYDLVRGGAWQDLDDGQREDWVYVARQVIG